MSTTDKLLIFVFYNAQIWQNKSLTSGKHQNIAESKYISWSKTFYRSLSLSFTLSANLLGLKVLTGLSGVSLLLQKTNTPSSLLRSVSSSYPVFSLFFTGSIPFSSSLGILYRGIAVHLPKLMEEEKKSGPGVI